MTETTSTAGPPIGHARRLIRHWPVGLAVGFAALMWGADPVGLAEVLILLPLVYVVTAAIHRRAVSWPVLVVCLAALVALRAQDQIAPSTGIFAIAAIALVGGLLSRRSRSAVLIQGAGLALFGGLALFALDSEMARLLVAAGWFVHGLWDVVHLRNRKVVSRSYAEWCAVLDVLIALQLVLVA